MMTLSNNLLEEKKGFRMLFPCQWEVLFAFLKTYAGGWLLLGMCSL
jgi:hypothetical protein